MRKIYISICLIFIHSRYTLKLKTCYEYNVQFEVSPSLSISYLIIGGAKYDASMTKIKKEDGKTFCSLRWSTERIKTTQRKYRTILPCVIRFSGYKEIQFEVLVKFYKPDEGLHYSGMPLSSLGLYGNLSNDQQKGEMYDIVFNWLLPSALLQGFVLFSIFIRYSFSLTFERRQ